jgi:hypothetical protein
MATLRKENGKHTVTHNGKEYRFNTLRIALIFIKFMEDRNVYKNR